MTFRMKMVLNIVVICVIFGIVFYTFFLPQINLTEKKRSEIIEIRQRSQQLLEAVSSYSNIDDLMFQEQERQKLLNVILPALKASPDVIHLINSEIKKAHIDVLSLKQENLSSVEFGKFNIFRLELSLSLQSNFFTLIKFMRSIYNNKNIIRIDSIRIFRDTSLYPVLIVSIRITTYFS